MSDLFDLMPSGPQGVRPMEFLRGGFRLGQTSVPFFSVSVSAGDLNQMLQLPAQMPVDPEQPIRIEELFQRDLDLNRVKDDIVPYLENDQKLRFFNALTVALLPRDPADPRRLAADYPNHPAIAPDGPDGLTDIKVGPITLSYRGEGRRVGVMTWNPELTSPIILDGQHRFHAIQQVLAGSGQRSRELKTSELSVLFIILDEKAGFIPPTPTSALSACRQIFIDLNRNARTVSRARLSLLDDREVGSVAMRAILSPSVDVSTTPVEERVAEHGQLPLTLVGWRPTGRSETAKFDSGPFITSLLTLQDMVDHVLGVRPFNSMDHVRAKTFVEELAARLKIDDDPGFDLPKRLDEVDAAALAERPFDLPLDAVRAAAPAFSARYGRRIVEPLVALTPYAEQIAALRGVGVLEGPLEPWLAFTTAEREALINRLGVDDPALAVERASKNNKARHPLAFQVVFQKAFVYALNSMLDRHEHLGEHWGLQQVTEAAVQAEWIDRFNKYIAPSLAEDGDDSAFYGAGIKADGTVDFRKTRIRSITGFVSYCLLAEGLPGWVQAESAGSLKPDTISDWISESWEHIKAGPRPPLPGLFSLHGKNWRLSVEELVGLSHDFEDDEDGTQKAEAVLQHATWQLHTLVSGAAGA